MDTQNDKKMQIHFPDVLICMNWMKMDSDGFLSINKSKMTVLFASYFCCDSL